MKPSGPPSKPRAYEMSTVAALPVQYLPRVVEIAPPMTPTELTEYLESPESGVVPATTTSSEESSTENNAGGLGWDDAPGLDNNPPPGQVPGSLPPGQVDNPGKKPPPKEK